MTTVLLAGILSAFVAVTLAAGMRRAPARVLCPACGAKTEVVQPPVWMRKTAPDLRVRWCPSCSWKGVGGGVHGVGFDWGDSRTPQDLGFHFADRVTARQVDVGQSVKEAGPAAHPSGFRFGGDAASPGPVEPKSDGRKGDLAAETEPEEPRGFQWRDKGPSAVPVFRWKG